MLDPSTSSMVEDRSTGGSRRVLEDRGAIRADDRPLRCPEIDDRPRGGVLGAVDFAPVSRARGSRRIRSRVLAPVLDLDGCSTLPGCSMSSVDVAPVLVAVAIVQGRNYWGVCG